eukprot:5130268-Lingulodinium_polyedra.AAC.1
MTSCGRRRTPTSRSSSRFTPAPRPCSPCGAGATTGSSGALATSLFFRLVIRYWGPLEIAPGAQS